MMRSNGSRRPLVHSPNARLKLRAPPGTNENGRGLAGRTVLHQAACPFSAKPGGADAIGSTSVLLPGSHAYISRHTLHDRRRTAIQHLLEPRPLNVSTAENHRDSLV